MASSLSLALTILALAAVNSVSAEIHPDPIPKVYPDNNVLDNTLYNVAFGSNNQIQKRITDLENYISELVNKGEKLINLYLDQVEANIIRVTNANGIANVPASITYVDAQVAAFEKNIYDLVDVLIKKIRVAVKKLETQLETETQASLAAGVLRSAITRINRLIEETISAVKSLLNRTKEQVEAIIQQKENEARLAQSNPQLNSIIRRAKLAIDRSILATENEINRRIWVAYQRVRSESKPLTALLHSLL